MLRCGQQQKLSARRSSGLNLSKLLFAIICEADACAIIRKQQGIIVSGRLLIPLRLLAEALDAEVSWDGERKAVRIVTEPAVQQQ